MQRVGEEGEIQLEEVLGQERKRGKWGPDILYEYASMYASGGIKQNSKGIFLGLSKLASWEVQKEGNCN